MIKDLAALKPFDRPFNSRTALRLGQALHLSLLIGTCLGTSIGISYAGPEGGVVSGGSATISQAGNSTTINQSSNRALIDWDSFNVDQHESVNFVQNGASSIAVNRIHDANPSTILGSLTANGQIILIN
ncbi:MAG TPA: filamentous hemagglutinin N-terminal domain-containing protein, partial [Alphaproteobacteria bacterium]